MSRSSVALRMKKNNQMIYGIPLWQSSNRNSLKYNKQTLPGSPLSKNYYYRSNWFPIPETLLDFLFTNKLFFSLHNFPKTKIWFSPEF